MGSAVRLRTDNSTSALRRLAHSSRLLSLAAVRICWPRLAGDSGQSALPCLATPVEQHVGVHVVPPGYLGDRRARH